MGIRKTYLLHSVTFLTVLIKFYWVDPSDGFPARPPRKSICEVEMRRRYGPILHSGSPRGGEEDVIASKLLSLPTSVFIIPHSSLHKGPQSYLRACNAWVWEMGSLSRLLWVIHISLIWTVPSSLKMDLSSLFLFFFWLKAGHKEASPYWTRLLDWDWFEAHSSGAPGSHATEQLCAMPSVILYI